ncbi:hypothetical protein, partial [Escherichia coli]|uniref:hypothetical protein n=1 Tax=Escherichia coli TaxID=562 RepID=UPI00215B4AC6
AKRKYFCSEFVVQCYIDCGYVDEEYGYHRPGRWSPSGLAEENFFDFVGFMSTCGLEAVDPADPYINGNLEVLTQEGRRCLVE